MKSTSESQRCPAVIGTGLIALDVVFGLEAPETPRVMVGGTCGNVLSVLSFLGWDAFPVARLGQDSASVLVKRDFQRHGVSLDFANQEPATDTPVIVQTIRRDASGRPRHRFSVTCPECGAWYPSFRAITAAAASEVVESIQDSEPSGFRPNVFFFDRVSRGALDLADAMSGMGALVVFEPIGLGDPKLFEQAMAVAHVLKYSHERLPDLASRRSRSPQLQLEIETRGAEGLRYRSVLEESWSWRTLKAYNAPVLRDTAGAGDWCTAVLLNRVAANGKRSLDEATRSELREAIRYSQAAAAVACAYEGARGAMDAINLKTFDAAVEAIYADASLVPFNVGDIRERPMDAYAGSSGSRFCVACSY